MLTNEAKKYIESITAKTKFYAQVRLYTTQNGTTRFANSEINQNVSITDTECLLTLYDGKKEATVSTNVLTEAGLTQLVQDAEALLAHVPAGEYEAFPFSKDAIKDMHPRNEALAKAFGTAQRAALIKEGIGQVQPGYTASGALTLTKVITAMGDSNDVFRFADYDYINFNTVVTHESGADGAGECCSYTNVPDVAAQFKKAQETATQGRDPIPPELGAHRVVLSPLAFGNLMYFMTMMLNAKAVDDGRSFAAGKLGQKLFSELLTVRDDVLHPDLRPMPFDYEGTPRKALSLIDKGTINTFVYDNKRAKKHNTQSTGHAIGPFGAFPANIIVDPGKTPPADLIAGTQKGIYINEFHYTNFVNPRNLQITGLTRNGTFLIENGEITKPIATVRFTESLLNAFNKITAVSSRQEKVGSGLGINLIPAVCIEDFHFTSKG